MKELYKMTKEQLIVACKRLQSENERLQDELDGLSDCYTELENEYADIVNNSDRVDRINNIEHFKWKLSIDNLLTPELSDFIDYYLKFHNEEGGE